MSKGPTRSYCLSPWISISVVVFFFIFLRYKSGDKDLRDLEIKAGDKKSLSGHAVYATLMVQMCYHTKEAVMPNGKKELQAYITAATADFLARGGKIVVLKPGVARG